MGRKQASGNQVLFFTRLMFTANRFQRLDGTSCREWIRLIHSVVKSTKIINGLVGVWGYVGSVRLRVLIMTEPSGTAASYQTASLPTFAPVGPRPRWWTLRWLPPPLEFACGSSSQAPILQTLLKRIRAPGTPRCLHWFESKDWFEVQKQITVSSHSAAASGIVSR